MKRLLVVLLLLCPDWASARTLLFVGNSFGYGVGSPIHHYRADSVTDLNGPDGTGKTLGGMPAMVKAFTAQAGLDYDVSVEILFGKGLDSLYIEKRKLLNRHWDDVVMSSYSTLDIDHPGSPALLISSAMKLTDMFRAQNPQAAVWLMATWSRADLTYPDGKTWSGRPIQQMARDIANGYGLAGKAAEATGVIPVGECWNRAIGTGLADDDPYDGIAAGKLNLWADDHSQASIYGYYLQALTIFGTVTGKDPLALGEKESVASELGISAAQARALQQIAHDELAASR